MEFCGRDISGCTSASTHVTNILPVVTIKGSKESADLLHGHCCKRAEAMLHSLSSNVFAPVGYLRSMICAAITGVALLVGELVQSGIKYRKGFVTLLDERYYSDKPGTSAKFATSHTNRLPLLKVCACL